MKKIFVAVLGIVLISSSAIAQKGNSSLGVGGDILLPTSDFGNHFKTGLGIYSKLMYGVGKSGQMTFTGGYSRFKESGDWTDFTTTLNFIPLLIGYRHCFNDFFVEPQLGYTVVGAKIETEDGFYTDSDGMFTWAAGVGYVFNKHLEVSGRFQNGGKQGTNIISRWAERSSIGMSRVTDSGRLLKTDVYPSLRFLCLSPLSCLLCSFVQQ